LQTARGLFWLSVLEMVLRANGEQVGVQIDEEQQRLALMAISAIDFDKPPHGLENVKLYKPCIVVGIMPPGDLDVKKDEWVCVVAVCEKRPSKKLHFVATQKCFGEEEDDIEDCGLPRLVTFSELTDHGELVGRFEGSTELDIQWYMDYKQDNNDFLPATGVSFPSADGYGPYGKGDYNEEGKAIKKEI